MIVKHHYSEPVMENPWGLKVIKYHDSEHGEVLYLTLDPDEKMQPHISSVNVMFYILEGKPTVRVGEQKVILREGTFIESVAGKVTCVTNEFETPVRLLIIKIPKAKQPPVFVNE